MSDRSTKNIVHRFGPEKPDALVERYGAELERAATPLMVALTGALRSVVDLANAQALLDRAIREAWHQGAAWGIARAPARMVVEDGALAILRGASPDDYWPDEVKHEPASASIAGVSGVLTSEMLAAAHDRVRRSSPEGGEEALVRILCGDEPGQNAAPMASPSRSAPEPESNNPQESVND